MYGVSPSNGADVVEPSRGGSMPVGTTAIVAARTPHAFATSFASTAVGEIRRLLRRTCARSRLEVTSDLTRCRREAAFADCTRKCGVASRVTKGADGRRAKTTASASHSHAWTTSKSPDDLTARATAKAHPSDRGRILSGETR